jgi:hypothetical protein
MDEYENEKESENEEIKQELYSLYKTILKIYTNELYSSEIQDISSYTILSLISNIRVFIKEIISLNNYYKENLSQQENMIKKLEFDVKYYLKNLLHYKIQNNSLEIKLNAFVSMEEDYEELKAKVKFEGGKFLENDRKDNEIIILRNENSRIKKEIKKLESQKIVMESEYNEKIKKLENEILILNNKISDMEKNNRENKNDFNSSDNLKLNIKDNKENIANKKLKKNNFNLSNVHNIINFTNNNFANNNKKLVNFHSPKDDLLYIERSRNKYNNKTTVNSNLFTATYNKIVNGINNNNKILFPFKKEFNLINYTRNKSISVMKGRELSESKTMSFNNNYNYNTEIKKKNFNKIMNAKQQNAFSLNSTDLKNMGQIDKKYANKNFNRIVSAKNIKNNKI